MRLKERHEAVALRKQGYSLKEIATKLSVAKSSVSLWVEDIVLSDHAGKRLLGVIKKGQFISAVRKKAHTEAIRETYRKEAGADFLKIAWSKEYARLLCALLYWCEGAKSEKWGVYFMNSDPDLIRKFLELLRNSFEIDERRFRACIHLHDYHSAKQQLDFWVKVTKIPKEQFIKPYVKPNTGKRIHPGYQGCISVRYHSNDLARRLNAIAKAFLGGIVQW